MSQVKPPIVVKHLNHRQHLARVAELEQQAAADRGRVYDGLAWTAPGFREYLRAGAGLVAQEENGPVVGFAVYHQEESGIVVRKFVAPTGPAEGALYAALEAIRVRMQKVWLDLPLVIEFQRQGV